MMIKNINSENYLCKTFKYNNELSIRRKKLLQLKKRKIAFPNSFRRNYTSSQLRTQYLCKTNHELQILNVQVSIAGRIIAQRVMGKASFIKLKDYDGYIQLYITINSLISKELYHDIIKQWDIGDIIGAKGILFKTHTGELSVHCTEMVLLTKSLRPLPNKFHGLVNLETRYRQRYLDLITNHASLEIFKIRSLIIYEIRQFMKQQDFIEVETPMMHYVSEGADARPFVTYHNKLKVNMYLRIAPELYLKKLIVGGFEKIFEINRNFRNESVSPYHNPEFTMMEIYMAYADYLDIIKFIEYLLCVLTKKIIGSNIIEYGKHKLNFNNSFTKMSVKEAIIRYIPEIQSKDINDFSVVIDIIKLFGIPFSDKWTLEKLHMVLFEEIASKKIIQPTCITHYPIEVSPLARCNDFDSKFADRFELFIAGKEIGNGFSELNDSEDQKYRFLKQLQNKDNVQENNKDLSYINYDEDYVTALEYGLPPTAGVGIGIDRLVMLLTNQHNIRDVILFPALRTKNNFYTK